MRAWVALCELFGYKRPMVTAFVLPAPSPRHMEPPDLDWTDSTVNVAVVREVRAEEHEAALAWVGDYRTVPVKPELRHAPRTPRRRLLWVWFTFHVVHMFTRDWPRLDSVFRRWEDRQLRRLPPAEAIAYANRSTSNALRMAIARAGLAWPPEPWVPRQRR